MLPHQNHNFSIFDSEHSVYSIENPNGQVETISYTTTTTERIHIS